MFKHNNLYFLNLQLKENILKVATQVNNLALTYDHKDWESILAHGTKDIFKSEIGTSSSNKFSWLQVQTITELYDGSLLIKLPDVQETSCCVNTIKLSVDKLKGQLVCYRAAHILLILYTIISIYFFLF